MTTGTTGSFGATLEHFHIGNISFTPFAYKKLGRNYVELCINLHKTSGECTRIATRNIEMDDINIGLSYVSRLVDSFDERGE